MYIREHKSVTVHPVRVLWVERHELVEQNVGDRGHTHRRTGVAGVGLGGGIDLYITTVSVMIVAIALVQSASIEPPIAAGWRGYQTYREEADCVDTQLVSLVVTHLC